MSLQSCCVKPDVGGYPRRSSVRLLLCTLGVVLSITWGTPSPSEAATANAILVAPQLYWGAIIDGGAYGYGSVPSDMLGVGTFEGHAGKPAALLALGGTWQAGNAFHSFRTADMDNIRAHGSIPVYTWLSSGDVAADFRNGVITSGRYDAYIRQWARDAKAWGHPFFLRFDAEMDGWWHPWGEGRVYAGGPIVNGNQPGDFVRMWRHVHDIFTQEGVANVTWIWAVNHEAAGTQYPPLAQIYPGDTYVDWTGIDPYNRYAGAWMSFNQTLTGQGINWMNDTYRLVLDVAPRKPIMLPEFGSIEYTSTTGLASVSSLGIPVRSTTKLVTPQIPRPGLAALSATASSIESKPVWLRDAILQQLPFNFPAIKAIVYFNWGIDNPSVVIESSLASQAAFANTIASPYYATNTFGTLNSSPIQPLTEQLAFLTPVADTYFAQDVPTSTFGGAAPFLYVSGAPGAHRTAYLRFDLTSLSGRTVDSAVLQVATSGDAWAGSTGSIVAHFDANNAITEQYASWNNQGGPWDVDHANLGSLAAPTLLNAKYTLTVRSDLVRSHAGRLLSFELDTTAPDAFVVSSREAADGTIRPQLIVSFH